LSGIGVLCDGVRAMARSARITWIGRSRGFCGVEMVGRDGGSIPRFVIRCRSRGGERLDAF